MSVVAVGVTSEALNNIFFWVRKIKVIIIIVVSELLLPSQGFGPEAKTRGGIIETPA